MRALQRVAGSMVAFLAGVSSMSLSVQAQDVGTEVAPNQLIAFDGKEYSGAAKVFSLAEGQLYSFVPSLGDLAGRISSFKLGSQVGAILFDEPLFQTTDKSCTPLLGTREEPHLLWQGATVDLLPTKRADDTALAFAAPKDDTYSSMIVYRRDVGPPPGVLMLQRLNTYSRGCANVLDQLNYRRAFVPAWEGGKTGYCQNLVGPETYESARGTYRFDNSDQLVFMHPEAYDKAYQTVKHNVRATLYDFPDCQGNHVTFPFKAKSIHKFNLADYGYKGRARSVKVEYVSGPAASVGGLAVASALPTTAIVKPVVSAQPSVPAVVETPPTPIVKPAPLVKTVPATQSLQAAPTTETAPVASLQSPSQSSVGQTSPSQVSAGQVPSRQVPVYSGADADLAAAGITPAGDDSLVPKPSVAPEGEVQRQVITSESQNPLFTPSYQLFEGQAEENVTTQSLGASSGSSSNENSLGSLPTEAAAQVASRPAGGTTFEYPVYDAYRLNYCLTPGTNCGEPAAREWCTKKGFSKALAWVRDDNIGSLYPTMNMGSKQVCSSYRCDGFKELTCGN
ncbi:hypothetical protein [Kiloniella antarctica]|uniref:Beta/gamma crystallin 'Greek key' domain-containing protein n=1 Tax=Kiloniella antarctica TaxID=1550907 RepID=A0ABW5BPZ2_9PROT